MKKHITIPLVATFSLLFAACGNMESGIRTFTTVQEKSPGQEAQLGSSANDYGYYGYEEAMDTHEQVVMEALAPRKQSSSESTPSEPAKVVPATEPSKTGGTPADVAENNPETKPEKPEVKPEAPTAPKIAKSEMVGPGVLKPTVYYFPVINEDEKSCAAKEKRNLHGAGGKVLLKVCSRTHAMCALQGTCGVIQNKEMHTFNIIGRFEGQDRFFEIPSDGCRFGYGVRNSCLDPFYTLAADLSIYQPGEVIFVPAVVGLVLPDGSVHSGYFVIRDKGRGIKGLGRFDFFTGHYSWLDPENPFKKLGLGDVNTGIPYFRIKGDAAKKVQAYRAYPDLPEHAVEE